MYFTIPVFLKEVTRNSTANCYCSLQINIYVGTYKNKCVFYKISLILHFYAKKLLFIGVKFTILYYKYCYFHYHYDNNWGRNGRDPLLSFFIHYSQLILIVAILILGCRRFFKFFSYSLLPFRPLYPC